jgi:LysR family transcriptional regulator, hypochlorite-specific transcription factor HypT
MQVFADTAVTAKALACAVMSSIDHKWLEDFMALARERSFSKAAALRHVTQPQFSRRIRALELWLGADVVNRANVPLTLTEAGEQLLPVARSANSQLSDVRSRIQSAQLGDDWVTLVTGRTLSRTWVPVWTQRMRQAIGAGFKLRVQTGSINDAVVALEQGHADFMLNYSHPRMQMSLDSSLFELVTVADEALLAVSAPAAPGKALHALPGSARQPVRVLRYAPTLALNHILQDSLARDSRELHLQPVLESDFAESLHEQALVGTGMAWLPRSLVQADLKAGRLVLADAAEHAARFEIQLCRPRRARSPLMQAVWKASVER